MYMYEKIKYIPCENGSFLMLKQVARTEKKFWTCMKFLAQNDA